MTFIINAVTSGWLTKGDFFVVDNAIVHSGGSVDILSGLLWNALGLDDHPIRIVVVTYSIMAPKLNPIELDWYTFVLHLKKERLFLLNCRGGSGVLVEMDGSILSRFIA